jgi:uncharacterized protein (TIGR02996 family)
MDVGPFVRAILDRPADDAPRLVLADYLEELGSAQGEFIRVQCERARLHPADRRFAELARREDELLRTHRRAWLRPMASLLKPDREYPGYPLQHVEFRRGLVEAIRVDASAFVRHAEEIMVLGPVRELCLIGMQSAGRAARLMSGLAKLTCWDRLEVLGIRLWDWTPAVVTAFLRPVHWPRLRELRLYGDAIGPDVIGPLIAWLRTHPTRVQVRDPNPESHGRIRDSGLRNLFE